ncbi:MAG: hypothetical protein KA196_02465 [Arenimonas sp.]|nr:hypothetical protein [Arenimonas sp.]
MLEAPVRVALLARPGDARDQLRRALAELGAHLVAEGDPAELDPGTVAGENPAVVLVSLEPALEDSLARFEDLLAAPGIDVIYDDAETTRQLDGWDLARWARHLAAKLVGSDLLPPAPGGADHLPEFDLSLEPGAPLTPAQEMAGEKLEDYAAESLHLSEWVPSEPSLAGLPMPEAPQALAIQPLEEDALDLDLDLGDLEQALGRMDADVSAATPSLAADVDMDALEFDPSLMDIDLSALPEEGSRLATLPDTDVAELAIDESGLADLELDAKPVRFSSYSDEELAPAHDLDDDVAALAAHLDAFEAPDHRAAPAEPDFYGAGSEPPPPAVVAPSAVPAAPAPVATSSFGSLELLPMDSEFAPAPPSAEPSAAPPPAVGQAKHLSLTGEGETENRATAAGAILIIAGLGGPDAVRQVLAALPPTLPLPVLLYQHLDTGKHDRLMGQLAKASLMPLDLAAEDRLAFSGRVSVLPPNIGVHYSDRSFRFISAISLAQVVSAMPAADSAVLVLSGADPAVVPAVVALQAAGALLLAQDPASCFDPVAARAAIAAGAPSAAPGDLARLVNERWP